MGDATFDLQGRRVCVAGHSGMLGSALVRRLADEDCRLLPLGRETLDLRDQAAVFAWFNEYRPDVVFVAAATVGGIYANDRQPADFLSHRGGASVRSPEARVFWDVLYVPKTGGAADYREFAA